MTDQASAVLSGSDEKNCNGFVKRQALYSCLTCAPDGAKDDFSKSIGMHQCCLLPDWIQFSFSTLRFRNLSGLQFELP